MNPCEKYEDLCSAALDDALTKQEQQELEQHLAVCPSCRAYMEEMRALCAMWKTLEVPVPESLHEKMMRQIEADVAGTIVQTPQKHRRRPPVFTMLAAAAACVVLAVSGELTGLFGQLSTMPVATSTAQVDPKGQRTMGSSYGKLPQTQQDAVDAQPDSTAPAPQQRAVSASQQGATPKIEPVPEDKPRVITPDAAPRAAAHEQSVPPQPAPQPSGDESAQDHSVMTASVGQEDAAMDADAENPAAVLSAAPSVPDALQSMSFARCFTVDGQGDLPVVEGMTLLVDEEDASYYSVENNESKLEKVRQELKKAGYELTLDAPFGITLQRNAQEILVICAK